MPLSEKEQADLLARMKKDRKENPPKKGKKSIYVFEVDDETGEEVVKQQDDEKKPEQAKQAQPMQQPRHPPMESTATTLGRIAGPVLLLVGGYYAQRAIANWMTEKPQAVAPARQHVAMSVEPPRLSQPQPVYLVHGPPAGAGAGRVGPAKELEGTISIH